ncbi:MAG: hypothetical protein E6J74_09915 [Deltaproteobacteria bacterium]|nr:MAG: hypothetical protein E6J74_09915 [Deltaproteobacteria bacterium]
MNNHLREIARRKQALIDRAARERVDLAKAYDSLPSPFDMSGTLLGIGRVLKTHPMIAAGLSSIFVSGYARRLLKPATELVKIWRIVLPIWLWWRKRRRPS